MARLSIDFLAAGAGGSLATESGTGSRPEPGLRSSDERFERGKAHLSLRVLLDPIANGRRT